MEISTPEESSLADQETTFQVKSDQAEEMMGGDSAKGKQIVTGGSMGGFTPEESSLVDVENSLQNLQIEIEQRIKSMQQLITDSGTDPKCLRSLQQQLRNQFTVLYASFESFGSKISDLGANTSVSLVHVPHISVQTPTLAPAEKGKKQHLEKRIILRGAQLLEVFHLVIHNKSLLHGSLTVNDKVQLYYRKENNCENIGPGQCASLIGPPDAIHFEGRLCIEVDLYDKISGENIEGIININAGLDRYEHNKPLIEKFTGENFSATLKYAFLRFAVKAVVEVRLVRCCNREDSAHVYGSVIAGNGWCDPNPRDMFAESPGRWATTLFKKSKGDCEFALPSNVIKLSRSVVAVPVMTFLRVYAKLMNCSNGNDQEEIANGFSDFFPNDDSEISNGRCHTFQKKITGNDGEIQVTVHFTNR